MKVHELLGQLRDVPPNYEVMFSVDVVAVPAVSAIRVQCHDLHQVQELPDSEEVIVSISGDWNIDPELDALITEEWLREIGFKPNDGDEFYLFINSGDDAKYDVQVWPRTGRVKLANSRSSFLVGYMETTTRKMMLSFLDGLGIDL